jgi:hypothetical protein
MTPRLLGLHALAEAPPIEPLLTARQVAAILGVSEENV